MVVRFPLARKAQKSFIRYLRGYTGSQNDADSILSIDRSGLFSPRSPIANCTVTEKRSETELERHLKSLIKFRGGPITLAEYMSEVLTNSREGYYQHNEVFGSSGDFVTSPEISQMFGEMVGIWCVATWQQLQSPQRLRIVELGPGKGTLMADLLRGTSVFSQFASGLSIEFVEISDRLRQLQWGALQCQGDIEVGAGKSTLGHGSIDVKWHRHIDEVDGSADAPQTLYIAHEFVDALPVHQFQKTSRGWCERLIDISDDASPLHLRFVLSPGPTPASKVILTNRLQSIPVKTRSSLAAIEVCPQGMVLADKLASRVSTHGGAALIIDYGQNGPYQNSLQAIRNHEFVGILDSPGTADLSARVDFDALKQAATIHKGVSLYGPITQASFLTGLGIEARLQQLMKTATGEQSRDLQEGFHRLVGSKNGQVHHDDGMGASYQALCIVGNVLPPPVPFT